MALGTSLLSVVGSLLGRRQDKMSSSFDKWRAQAALENADSEIGFRQLEDPREQSLLKQSMFGRGLGKSTINDQAKARLTDIQARRMAALSRQREEARRGLSLIRKRRKFSRRMFPFNMFQTIVGGIEETAGLASSKPKEGQNVEE